MSFFHKKRRAIYDENAIEGLTDWSAQQFLLEHLRNANLQRRAKTKSNSPDKKFRSNEEFWRTILNNYSAALGWVELTRFRLVDWFPRTPGLFHTPRARRERKDAEKYAVEEAGIKFYTPYGKAHMIEGGLGDVRFKPSQIGLDECWLCTATSDEYCHTGIPLAVSTQLIEDLDLKFDGEFKITGHVRFLPGFLEEHFFHMEGIPQIYIVVEEMVRLEKEEPRKIVPEIKITPMVFFKGPEARRGEAFVTYVHCDANSTSELDVASEWISLYVDRFNGTIITNFDQQRPMFKDAPFSLQNVMSGRIDKYQLQEFHIENAEIISDLIQNINAEKINVTKKNFRDSWRRNKYLW